MERVVDMNNKTKKVVQGFLLLFVVNLLFFLFFVLPQKSKASGWHGEIANLRSEITNLSRDHRAARHELTILKNSKDSIDQFENKILSVRGEKIDKIMKFIDNLTFRFRLERLKTNFVPVRSKDNDFERIRIQFLIKGDYRGIRYYINNLENSELFLVIDKIQLINVKTENKIQANVSMSTFFKKEDM